MDIEDRLARLERKVDRYRRATVVLALLLVAGVTMGQTSKNGDFDYLTCKQLTVRDENGTRQVLVGGDDSGGVVATFSREGKTMTALSATKPHPATAFSSGSTGSGVLRTYSADPERTVGPTLVSLGADGGGNGAVFTTTKAGVQKRLD